MIRISRIDARYGSDNLWHEDSGRMIRAMPWRTHGCRFLFEADEPLSVSQEDLVITGANAGPIATTSFVWDEPNLTATWTFAEVTNDLLTLTIFNRTAYFAILYGDCNGDYRVTIQDLYYVRSKNNTNDKWADVSGDGQVSLLDSLLVRTRAGIKLEHPMPPCFFNWMKEGIVFPAV